MLVISILVSLYYLVISQRGFDISSCNALTTIVSDLAGSSLQSSMWDCHPTREALSFVVIVGLETIHESVIRCSDECDL